MSGGPDTIPYINSSDETSPIPAQIPIGSHKTTIFIPELILTIQTGFAINTNFASFSRPLIT